MRKIEEILKVDFSLIATRKITTETLSYNLEKLCSQRLSILTNLKDKIGESQFELPPAKSISDIFRKVKHIIKSFGNLKTELTKKEIRILTHSLSYSENAEISLFNDYAQLKIVLESIDFHWKTTYLIGLLDCYLSNWESEKNESKKLLGEYVLKKLNSYNGKISLINSFKTNAQFLSPENGNELLGAFVALKNLQISQVTNQLGLPLHYIKHPYFSKCLIAYIQRKSENIGNCIDEIYFFLKQHNYSKTNKLVISKLILESHTKGDLLVKDKIKNLAFSFIGDPSITHNWMPFQGATLAEINQIEKAKNTLNEWITQEFINVFFEKCINDKRRKIFWLKYSKKITTFKVFGPVRIKKLLESDDRIKQFVSGRYHVCDSNQDVSAIMFLISDYKLVEFSNPGYAFYAYKITNKNIPSIDYPKIHSVDMLRQTNMRMLVYRNGNQLYSFSEEGRLAHSDGYLNWESVFSTWLKNTAGINV